MWGRRGSQGGFLWGKTVGIEFPRISRNSPGRGREESPGQKEMSRGLEAGAHGRGKERQEASVVDFRGQGSGTSDEAGEVANVCTPVAMIGWGSREQRNDWKTTQPEA